MTSSKQSLGAARVASNTPATTTTAAESAAESAAAKSFSEPQIKNPPTKGLSSAVRNLKFMMRKSNQKAEQEKKRQHYKYLQSLQWVVPGAKAAVVPADSNTSNDSGSVSIVTSGIRCIVDKRVGRHDDDDDEDDDDDIYGEQELQGRRSFGRFNKAVENPTETHGK